MKRLIFSLSLFSTLTALAGDWHMDCFTRGHDVTITSETDKSVRLNFTIPGKRQDVWQGPYSGVYQNSGQTHTFRFEGAELRLDRDLRGEIIFPDGSKKRINCNKPFAV